MEGARPVAANLGEVMSANRSDEASGARERVEGRIATLVHDARIALDRAELTPEGRMLLDGAVTALTERER